MEVWSRRKWLAIVLFALTAAAAVTCVLSLPNVYRATATVVVEQPRADTTVPGELEMRLHAISQQILSRSRLEALINGFGLYQPRTPSASMEGVVAQMRRDIRTDFKTVSQPGGLSIIAFTLSYRGTEPETVARVTNALASFYVEEDLKRREQQTSGTVDLLKTQLEDLKRDLQEQERAVAAFQDQHMGELPQHRDANLAALDRYHAELRTTSEEKARALSRRDELMRRLAEADTGAQSLATDLPAPDAAAARLSRLKEELSRFTLRYSDKYPDVSRLKSEIAALEQQLSDRGPERIADSAPHAASRLVHQLRESLAEVESEISNLKTAEASLRANIAGYVERLENAPRRQRGFEEISRDYQTTRDLYASVRRSYEQAQLEQGSAGGKRAPRFRIMDSAVAPAYPVAPNRPLLLFLALIGSLVVAASSAALAERLDTSFHAAEDVRSFTRVPVLASIPLIVTLGDRRRYRWRFSLAAVSILVGLAIIVYASNGLARNQGMLVSILAPS